MRNTFIFRSVNCFMVAVISICTCGFTLNPVELGKFFRRDKEPVIPDVKYIKLDKKVTQDEFFQLINNFSDTQKKELFNSFAKKGKEINYVPSTEELINAMHAVSRHWSTRYFTDFNYHETVKWTAKELGVSKVECDCATTFQLEHKILENLFSKMWDRLSVEDRAKVLKDAEMPDEWKNKNGTAVCTTIATVIGTMSNNVAAASFAFYILMAKTIPTLTATLGGITATTTIIAGPSGWINGLAWVVVAASLIGQADVSKCASFIARIHLTKIEALGKANVDISPYLLK